MNASTKLSQHFTIGEFIKTSQDTKNNPNAKYRYTNAEFKELNLRYVEANYQKMKEFCEKILEPIRAHVIKKYGFKYLGINSGIRCIELNAVIGGAITSQHTQCEAADLNCGGTGKLTKAIFEDIINSRVEGLDTSVISQCILERKEYSAYNTYWVHIGYKTDRWVEYKNSKGVKDVKPEYMVTLTGKSGSYKPVTAETLAAYV